MTILAARRAKRRKRNAVEARQECLVAARLLLLTEGPAAVTLSKVGRATGMSHTNIIHHFGSAGDLQSALMGSMVHDLMTALGDVVAHVREDISAPGKIVDQAFNAFSQGGGGQLAAWLALTQAFDHLQPIEAAVRELVGAMSEKFEEPEAAEHMRRAVLLIAVAAFGDAIIGPTLREMMGLPADAMRSMTEKLLPFFFVAPSPIV